VLGRTEFNRPGLDRLRNFARSGRIDAVLAWKRDRYFGDPALRAVFEREMETYGVHLLAMDGSGGDRPEDKFSDGIYRRLSLLVTVKPSGDLVVVGEPDANWLPESSAIDEASLEDARKLDQVLQGLQTDNNGSPLILRTMEPP
jgi:hypothetical protein